MCRDLFVGEVFLDCFAGRKVQSVRKRQLPNRKAGSLGVWLQREHRAMAAGLRFEFDCWRLPGCEKHRKLRLLSFDVLSQWARCVRSIFVQ